MPGDRRTRPFLELWGWAEFREASGRSEHTLRYLQQRYPDEFPQPVARLRVGPVYAAVECREFLAAHPKGAGVTPAAKVRAIYALRDAGLEVTRIHEETGVPIQTIYRWLQKRERNR